MGLKNVEGAVDNGDVQLKGGGGGKKDPGKGVRSMQNHLPDKRSDLGCGQHHP